MGQSSCVPFSIQNVTCNKAFLIKKYVYFSSFPIVSKQKLIYRTESQVQTKSSLVNNNTKSKFIGLIPFIPSVVNH